VLTHLDPIWQQHLYADLLPAHRDVSVYLPASDLRPALDGSVTLHRYTADGLED
jgi:hypothetical protein